MDTPLWQPDERRVEDAHLSAFIKRWQSLTKSKRGDYAALYDWSIREPEGFWTLVWDHFGVIGTRGERILSLGDSMLGSRWFEGSTLNFAENLLRGDDNTTAIIWGSENGDRSELTYKEVRNQVAHLAGYLEDLGIQAADRVCGYLPNIPETVIGLLASATIGATWSACSPDFGISAVLERFAQISPSVLICAREYSYNGKRIDCLERIREISLALPSLKKIILISEDQDLYDLPSGKVTHWSEVINHPKKQDGFRQFPFRHPLCIVYSSGTTGKPKCIVHGIGGTLLQHLKDLALHSDVKSTDRFFYYTTCGWMMWNWLVSGLSLGSTIVLYDGSPGFPTPDALLGFAAKEKISIFGTSAKYLATLQKFDVDATAKHDLSSLRTILSTGSPLVAEQFDYVYSKIKSDVCLSSISGGTDILSCFALGNPTLPVYRGELQSRGLGMRVEIYDEHGLSVREKKGELVCTAPFPCMPIYFWNDPENVKYRESYFAVFPNVWRHGDWAKLTTHDGLIIYGRSDAVLNPAGVRIGTAELYGMVEQFKEVLEALAVGQEWQGEERVVLFVKCRVGTNLDSALIERIRNHVRKNLSPKHVPAKIIQVPDIPKTINGKIVELAVKNVIHNRSVKNLDALANPEALEFYRNLDELKS